jgi:hypothetical protein
MASVSETATSTKRALKDVSNATISQEGSTKKHRTTEQDEEKQRKQMNGVIRKVQGQINAKLKWKNSFKQMKNNSDIKKGGRVEVVCNDPAVFEKIFDGATIKKGKDGKLSCSFKTDDEVRKSSDSMERIIASIVLHFAPLALPVSRIMRLFSVSSSALAKVHDRSEREREYACYHVM